MKKANDSNRMMHAIYIGVFSILLTVLNSSCGSISPKYLIETADRYNISKVEAKQIYVFENFPQKIGNLVDADLKISPQYNMYCLWNFIEPDYYKKDSLQYLYKASLELKSNKKVLFKLIDPMGNVVREKTKRYKLDLKDFVAIRNTDIDFYLLFNRFITEKSCFAIDRNGDLIVPNEFVAGGFLVLFPIAGGQDFNTSTYRRVRTANTSIGY